MARPVTTKHIKETYQCSCGYNSVDEYTAQLKSATLRQMGMKRKRFTDTKQVFYHMMHKANCTGHYEN